jgi:hypothetical protein
MITFLMPVLDEESLLSVQLKYDHAACSCVVVVYSKIREVTEHRVSLQAALYMYRTTSWPQQTLKCGNKFYDIMRKKKLHLCVK